MAAQQVAGGGGRRLAPQQAGLGSAAPFQPNTAAFAGDAISGFGAVLGQQTGQGPAGCVQHADVALGADQDSPVAIRQPALGGLAGRFE